MFLYFLCLIMIAVSLLASLTNYFIKRPPQYLKIFPVFLLSTLLVELAALIMAETKHNNLLLYSIFNVLEFVFYLYFFYSVYLEYKAKRIALYTMVIYACAAFVNIFFIQGVKVFHTYTYMLGCGLIIIFGIYYFYRMLKFPQPGKITNEPAFWITAALLFYYCCTLPVFGLLNYTNSLTSLGRKSLMTISSIMNVLLYGLFAVAFLCKVKIRKIGLN